MMSRQKDKSNKKLLHSNNKNKETNKFSQT